MNQEKIGKFIAVCRKEKKLTQNELAEKLNITNKAVSKWETGRGMPDSSILLELSKILDVTVNELLSGERLQVNEYKIKAEENIIAIVNENKKSSKKIKILFLSIIIFICLVILVLSRYIGGFMFSEGENIMLSDLKLNIVFGDEKLTHIRFISGDDSNNTKAEIIYTFKDDKCVSERMKFVFVDEKTANEQYERWEELGIINLVKNENEVCFNSDENIGKSKQEILDNTNMEYVIY